MGISTGYDWEYSLFLIYLFAEKIFQCENDGTVFEDITEFPNSLQIKINDWIEKEFILYHMRTSL